VHFIARCRGSSVAVRDPPWPDAFDLRPVGGTDVRRERLDDRRAKLRCLLAPPDGIRFSEHLAGDGARMSSMRASLGSKASCASGGDSAYCSGRCKSWLKVKNPESPAMRRLENGTW
jgi:ATP-dependent DNA ligase